MKRIFFALFLIVSLNLLAQEDESVPIQIIEVVPVYEGCVGSNSELKDCLNRKIYEHFSKNFIYPKLKKKESIVGRYFISFKIDKEGNFILINVKGPDLRDLVLNEIKRIFTKFPKIQPASQRNKPVAVVYNLPFVVN
jgi:hypothetical protein